MSQALFDHMSREHGLILLESEMHEIERIVRKENDERITIMRSLPPQVPSNWIRDAVSDEIGMCASSFALGMDPRFRTTTPVEMFDICCVLMRERIVARQPKEHL